MDWERLDFLREAVEEEERLGWEEEEMKGNEAEGLEAMGRSVRGGARLLEPEAIGVERVKAEAAAVLLVVGGRGWELEAERRDDDFGCFFARGLGEGAGVVEEAPARPDEMVRFLDRLVVRALKGDLGGGAWEVALRWEEEEEEGKRKEGEAGAGREGARRPEEEEGGG